MADTRMWLGNLKEGSKVNLERALQVGARYGGHFVQVIKLFQAPFPDVDVHSYSQGHVDTTATIMERTPDGNSIRFLFQMPPANDSSEDHQLGLVTKGYVAIDGTSLTITSVDDDARTFGIMMIAHTQDKVALVDKQVGDKVNIEIDIVTKSVSKIVEQTLAGSSKISSALEAMVDKAVAKALQRQQQS